jgi:hypothetical protein
VNRDNDDDRGLEQPGLPCAFDKLILQRRARCDRAARKLVAEREIVGCSRSGCSERCATFLAGVMARAHFVTRGKIALSQMPYSQKFRFQLGSINGLRTITGTTEGDIDSLVEIAQTRPGSFDSLPYDVIVREISAARMRPGANRR